MSVSKLFQTLVAGRICKSPVSETAGCPLDSQRPRVSGTQLSCASVSDQVAIIGHASSPGHDRLACGESRIEDIFDDDAFENYAD